MGLLIKNGRVVDPANRLDGVLDVLLDGATVAKVAKNIGSPGHEVLDAAGKIVMPGCVDMHVHLREPGREDKETIATGTSAAAKGGVTTVLAMPNTWPALDTIEAAQRLKEIIAKSARVRVAVAGAMTTQRAGEVVVDIAALKEEGIVAVTDDGASVEKPDVMREVLRRAGSLGLPAICHCEDRALSNGGVINLGLMSTILGLRGIPSASEYKRVERDIVLAGEAAAAVHIAHISCRESVELVRQAKAKGLKVTAETAPHYFSLSEDVLAGYDTNYKMNPPLRSRDDRMAILEGLKDGTIDCIASDHAPHTDNEKEIEFDRAEFGVIGLETELSAAVTQLIETKVLDWPALVAKLSLNPATILGLKCGTLAAGASADITIVDPEATWVVAKEGLVSKSKNCAFLGRTLKGVVTATIVNGVIVYKRCLS